MTRVLIAWVLCIAAAGSIVVQALPPAQRTTTTLHPAATAAAVLVGIIIAAVAWSTVLRKKLLDPVIPFAGAGGIIIVRVLIALHVPLWGALAIAGCGAATYIVAVRYARTSWRATQRSMWVSNAWFAVCFIAAGAIFANALSPASAALILVCIAIYDWLAVRKLGTMQTLATTLLQRRTFPGIALPKSHDEESPSSWVILGGGDCVLIIAIPGAFVATQPLLALWIGAGMLAATVGLLLFSKEGKMYPAVPYLLAGALGGVASGVAVRALAGVL
jgi:presenilin-like A22 family membrane protease